MRLPTIEVPATKPTTSSARSPSQAGRAQPRRLHRHQRQGHDAARRRPRPRPAPRRKAPTKPDLIVDAAKVEELMGVPPEKVADVMALMGDSIDNIPGAKGIGEKGARELIRRFGSVGSRPRPRRRSRRQALSRSAASTAASRWCSRSSSPPSPPTRPIELDLEALARREPDYAALRDLYAELGFTSLLQRSARGHHGLHRRHRLRRPRFARRRRANS